MKVVSLRLKTDSGEQEFTSLNLIASLGVEGDKKAKGGERQICFCDDAALNEYRTENKGLCVKRFMPNITTNGLDYQTLKPGDLFSIGTSIIEISPYGKRCFDECPFVQSDKSCAIKENCAFGMIIESGTIEIDDEIVKQN